MKNNIMKNKKRKTGDFRQFKQKIFILTLLMGALAIVSTYALYVFILEGNIANWTVDIFQKLFRIDYYTALNLYSRTIRDHTGFIFLIAIAIVYFIIFHIYLNRFTRYFEEINRGMDILIREDAGDVSLSPELLPMERKLNTVKHTLEKQKNDMTVSEQRKNDLIVYLAHDLKTPLASVIGYLNLLCDEGEISEELRQKYLSISLEKAERLEELINEFFEIARFNLSHINLQYGRISLTRLLEQLVFEFKPMLGDKNLTCNLRVDGDIILRCDADKIQRVFDNLLRNAVLYSFPDTEIEISASCDNEKVTLYFVNHGDTIPEDGLERIFEQFYRLDAARSTTNGGAGLGLAISRQIVELHGGTITAKSENELTTFIVALPIV